MYANKDAYNVLKCPPAPDKRSFPSVSLLQLTDHVIRRIDLNNTELDTLPLCLQLLSTAKDVLVVHLPKKVGRVQVSAKPLRDIIDLLRY